MKIFLVGMMGSGKSKMGKKLASLLNMDFVDVDEYIENKEGVSVSDLFDKKGEQNFRKLEQFYLREILVQDHIVVSTGGGLPCYFENMELMNKHGVSVYLEATAAFLKSRLIHHKEKRPLIANIPDDSLEEFLDRMLKTRDVYYKRSNITISAKNIRANKIKEALNTYGFIK